MNYWLVKSEGDCYSIDNLKRDKKVAWEGVRNYQARNFMRDKMQIGDMVLFYHSNGTPAEPNGIYGVAKVVSKAHIDESALNPKDEHFDPTAVKYEKEGKPPMWMCVDIGFVKKLTRPVTLDEIKRDPALNGMLVVKRGQRLSVMPVSERHFKAILALT